MYLFLCFIFISESTGQDLPLEQSGFVVDKINPVEKCGNIGKPDIEFWVPLEH